MPIIARPDEFNIENLYVDLSSVVSQSLYLKCEGFNFAGSIKLKTAVEMVDSAERSGLLSKDSTIVESSSGNLGVALAMIAASRGYQFVCVTDVRCNTATRELMEAFGALVHTISEPHPEHGYLGSRLEYVQKLCSSDSRNVWLNQYANPNNWIAHYRRTAPALSRDFSGLDVLFIGAGTTGTLMGCAQYFRRNRPDVTIVAVDSAGSVSFGGPGGPRMIPGLGAGVRPQLLDESLVDDVVLVPEYETVRTCHQLASHGYLFGGSTGTVVTGAVQWLAENRPHRNSTAVAISPDLGERYLDSVYEPDWVQRNYGLDVRSRTTHGRPLTASGAVE
ncbi:2,3-diaminopropionate biosynthesis protein SbnA [Streptomyces sp. HNM0663]|uniref:2,3-diaminopropionate biosynthesis protein SbnA n=1 Tax=Streptomyces chengmaiensis TaxID=3040919 RepID=A0ABT6HQG0_9ACTN|nr:2,3-diaminopropionate biosynthesis protein SbnA [Streptomyces chengmaiensis]MDH2390580.1 2,3-diaminopropionate biosynthesis protein SbnA [Streptomyces chengmaiensis]